MARVMRAYWSILVRGHRPQYLVAMLRAHPISRTIPGQAGRTVANGGVLMSEKKSRPMSPESILSTLEHISQAIDAMTAVVGELRSYLDNHWEVIEVSSIALEPEELELAEMEANTRTVH